MATRMTVFFSSGRYSWSESHILTASGLPPDFQPQAIAYAQLRCQLLGAGATLDAIRLSELPANRTYDDVDYNLFPSNPVWPSDPTGLVYVSDRAYSSVLVRMKTPLYVRNWYIAGVPDGLVNQATNASIGLNTSAAPAWLPRFQALMQLLTTGNVWGFASLGDSVLTIADGMPVTLAAFPGQVGIPTAAALAGVVQGSQVLLRGWRRNNVRLDGLSGFYQVSRIVPPTDPAVTPYTYMLARTGNVSPTNFESVGKIGLATPGYHNYTDFDLRKAVKRARGGSYGLPRGRSRTSA